MSPEVDPEPTADPKIVVPQRFNGPPRSANGGYLAGLLAARLGEPWSPVSVTLRRPPPLETALHLAPTDAGLDLLDADGLIARAAPAVAEPGPAPQPVETSAAHAASADFPGRRSHPFPTCFVCGIDREDGLRIFPGPVRDGGADPAITTVAAPWTPDDSLPRFERDRTRAAYAVAWAALDCIGGWAGDLEERMMVLATMTARVEALPEVGAQHVVIGRSRSAEGRKVWTSSALFTADGALLGRAEHLWVAVDPAVFASLR